MVSTTIDSIVRSQLLHYNLPLHYYLQFLNYALTCLRELEYDVLRNTKTVELPIDEFGEVDLPTDYVDWSRVSTKRGRYLIPLAFNGSYNPLPKLDENGNQVAYPNLATEGAELFVDAFGYNWGRVNVHAEHQGGYYGVTDQVGKDFRIDKNRGKIILGWPMRSADGGTAGTGASTDEWIDPDGDSWDTDGEGPWIVTTRGGSGAVIVLEYIHFDQANASSMVHPYAESTISTYIRWQYTAWSPQLGLGQEDRRRREYYRERTRLNARMNPITKEGLLRVLRKNFHQSPKT